MSTRPRLNVDAAVLHRLDRAGDLNQPARGDIRIGEGAGLNILHARLSLPPGAIMNEVAAVTKRLISDIRGSKTPPIRDSMASRNRWRRRMGRPPLRKCGAYTAAERQRRRRKRLRAKRRAQEQEELRAKNQARYNSAADQERRQRINDEADRRELEWQAQHPAAPPLPGGQTAADEIARQLAELLQENQDMTIMDIRAAITRRFGPSDL